MVIDQDPNDPLPSPNSASAKLTQPIPAQQAHHAASLPQDPNDPLPDPSAPAATPSIWDSALRGVGLGTRAVIEGAGGLADLATAPGRWLNRQVGLPSGTPPTQLVTNNLPQSVGLPPLPTPQTPLEQDTSTAVRGGAALLPSMVPGFGPFSIPTATATPLSLTRAATTSGIGSLAGEKVANSDIVPPWAKPSADLLTNVLATHGANVATNVGTKAVNAFTDNQSDIYKAFQRSQVDPTLVGTVAGGEGGQSLEAAASRIPFANAVVRPVQQKVVDQFGNSVENTASQLDPQGLHYTPEGAGTTVQSVYRNWKDKTFPQQQDAAWAPLNQRLAGTSVSAAPYQAALDSVTSQLSLPATQKALTPGLAMQLRLALAQDAPGGTFTWEQAQQLRSLIGKVMGVPEISQSVGMDNLKRAYAGVSEGMRDTATANGQGALFANANQVSTDGHAFIDNVGSKIAKAGNPSQESIAPEQATNNLLNGGSTTMQAVRDVIPDAADALAAYNLRRAQMAPPGTATNYADTSTGRFLTNINQMRQQAPGKYDALYNTPGLQQQIDDLSTVAGRLRATEKHLNTSGTAEQLGWMQWLTSVADAVGSGDWKRMATSTLGVPAIGKTVGNIVTNPELTRFAASQGAGPPLLPAKATGLLGALPYAVGQ